MDWDTTKIVALTTAMATVIGVLGGAVIILWKKWREAQQEAAKGDVDVTVKTTDAANKHRQEDADFEARENQRIIEYWKSLNAEMSERSRIVISSVEAKVKELEVEGQKRLEEHIKCQLDNAAMKVQVEHLKEQVAALNSEKNQLRDRVAALEAKK